VNVHDLTRPEARDECLQLMVTGTLEAQAGQSR
jgi:hypothetical protein